MRGGDASGAGFSRGRFEILRELGRGGMGAVYEVHDREHDLRVALKTVSRLDPYRILQLKREFRAVCGLRHRNLVELYELIAAGDEGCFFTMELLAGEDLRAWVRRGSGGEGAGLGSEGVGSAGTETEEDLESADTHFAHTGELGSGGSGPAGRGTAGRGTAGDRTEEEDLEGADTHFAPTGEPGAIAATQEATWSTLAGASARPASASASPASAGPANAPATAGTPRALAFDEARLRRAVAELADGLAFLHERGVVHRDIKPSNALVGEGDRIVLLDFGFAADWRPQPWRRAASSPPLAGTVPYMAPEYLHAQVVSPAMDSYALGVLLFELVTGAPPFSGPLYRVVTAHIESEPPRAAEINPAVPRDVDALIRDLLTKDPASRPSAAQARARALGDESAPAPPKPPPAPPLVGREAELESLEDALSRAGRGAPQLALVEGGAGSGKTALVEAFLRRLPMGEVAAFRGRCHQREGVPFRAFDEIAEELAADVSEEQSLRAAADELPRHLASLARVFPVFAVAAETAAIDPAPPADARDERERALGAFADLLALRLRGRAGVLAIEDLQWADAESLDLLSILFARSESLPLLVLVTARAEEERSRRLAEFLADAKRGDRAASIALEPLSRPHLRELLEAVARVSVGDDTLEAVHRATRGVPYAAAAIAQEVAAADAPLSAGELDVGEFEDARIRRLAPDEARVAEAAAAAFGAATFAELRAAAELTGPRFLSAVYGLERERILGASPAPEGDIAYDFYHERLRERIYANLSADERSRLHRRFAAALSAQRGARALDLESRQWQLAGEPSRAAAAARGAAEEARAQLAFERAAELYERALSLGLSPDERERAREGRAEALLLSNDFEGAAARAAELAEERSGLQRDRWRVRCAEAALKLGDVERGVAELERVLRPRGLSFQKSAIASLAASAGISARVALLGRGGGEAAPRSPDPARPPQESAPSPGPGRPSAAPREDEILADAYRVAAYFLSTPAPREAWEFVLRTVADARRRGDRGREACGFAMMAGYLEIASLGRVGRGLFGRARRAAAAARDPYADLVVQAVGVMRATVAGDWPEMRARADRGEAICREMGMEGSWEAAFLRTYNGLAEIFAGQIERALAILSPERRGRRRPDFFSRALATVMYGRALLWSGRVEEAERAEAELAPSPLADEGTVAMWLALFRAEIALARGDYAAAAEGAGRMRRLGAQSGLGFWPVFKAMRRTLSATAELGLAGEGSPGASRARARRAAAEAAALYRVARSSFYEPSALRLLAQAQAAMGRSRRAARTLERAATSAEHRGGDLERRAIAALRGDASFEAHPALAWLTAGAARPLGEASA